MTFEMCAETIAACMAAKPGGADRIELCSALVEDGLSPSYGMIRQAVALSGLPVHVMLRPRAGNFVYTAEEFEVMREDLAVVRELGAAGVVLGILLPDNRVDVRRTAELVGLAKPLEVTFHRAVDRAPHLPEALEQIIEAGCHRVLTSGGQPEALAGAAVVRQLCAQAAGRIAIAVGGSLRVENAAEIRQLTGASHFHGSARSSARAAGLSGDLESAVLAEAEVTVGVEQVRALVTALQQAESA